MEDTEDDSADLATSAEAEVSNSAALESEQDRSSQKDGSEGSPSDPGKESRTGQLRASEVAGTAMQDRQAQLQKRSSQESIQPAQEPMNGGEDVAPWSTEAAEAPPAGGQAQAAEAPLPANGASKEGGKSGSPGKRKTGPAQGKEGDKPRWGIGNKKALDKSMATRSFLERDLSPAKKNGGVVKKAGATRRPSKHRDVSPVITRAAQKEANRQRLAERQKEEKELLEKRLAAKSALLQSIKENLKNEVASQQLSAYLEKKRAQRERWYLKRYGRLPAHRLDVEVSPQLLPLPATLHRHPPAALSLRKGLPSAAPPLQVSIGSPTASLSGSSQAGSPSRPPWNGSPKVAQSEYSSEGGSPLGMSSHVFPLPAAPLPATVGRVKQPKGSPKAPSQRTRKPLLDTDSEMQVLKAVRRREELLGRLRTLLLAKADNAGTLVPHSSAVSSCLDSLRLASLDAVEAVQAWRVEQGHQQRPFVWAGQDYLAKMNTDLGNLLHKEAGVHAWLGFDIWLDPFCTGLLPAAGPAPLPGAARYAPVIDGSQALRVKAALTILADAAGSTAQLTKQRVELLGSPSRGNRDLRNKQPLGSSPAPSKRPSSDRRLQQEEAQAAAPDLVLLQDSRTSDKEQEENLGTVETELGSSGPSAAEEDPLLDGGGGQSTPVAAAPSRHHSAEGPRMAGTQAAPANGAIDGLSVSRGEDGEADAGSTAGEAATGGPSSIQDERLEAKGLAEEGESNGPVRMVKNEPLPDASAEEQSFNDEITFTEPSAARVSPEASVQLDNDETLQEALNFVALQETGTTTKTTTDRKETLDVSGPTAAVKGSNGLHLTRMSSPAGTHVGSTLEALLTEVVELEQRDD